MRLSDRDVTRFSLDAWVEDLEAVVDAAGLDRFALLGISGGGPTSIAYAGDYIEFDATTGAALAGPGACLIRSASRSLIQS